MTKSKLHNALLAVTLAGGLFAGAGSAYATPGTLFTAFNFLEFDTDSVVPAAEFETISALELEWREGAVPTSFLRILGASNTNVGITSDDGLWIDVAQVEHENNIIPGGAFTFDVHVVDFFELTDATNSVIFDDSGTNRLQGPGFSVTFTETANVSGSCNLTVAGNTNPLGSVCDDVFTIGGLQATLGTFLFSANDERWALSIRVLAEAAAGSFFDGNETIFTAEDFVSNVRFQIRVDQLEVPEPATLALLGIGLLGLPLARRCAAKKA